MRFIKSSLWMLGVLFLAVPLPAQQPSSGGTQALQILQRSLSALDGQVNVADATLTGTARHIAGSDDETGQATLKALAIGASRIDIIFPSGQRTEIHNLIGTTQAGMWSSGDGVNHPISWPNLAGEPIWFFPTFAISPSVSSSAATATYVGQEVRNGETVEHVSVSQYSAVETPTGTPSLSHMTQVDFFLDASTYLPAAIAFNVHPDNTDTVDIPVDVEFSDYRPVNGVQVPFHIQRFMNNSLTLDVQVQTAAINSGLPESNFNVQ